MTSNYLKLKGYHLKYDIELFKIKKLSSTIYIIINYAHQ